MKDQETESIFDRSGLAALTDIQTEVCQNTFSVLEGQQSEFLSHVSEFRSEEYRWPNDPLHTWSRVWEYPYVYYHLARFMKDLVPGNRPVIADVGSGVTFFPFSIAQLGYEVICADIDPVCEIDISRASQSVPASPGNVQFRLVSNDRLPFADGECDALYCISVLEHIPDFENTVKEMARVLKPGGICLITCDIGLDPAANTQLDTSEYGRLMPAIKQDFKLRLPDRTIHPGDLLTNRNSPYPGVRHSCSRTGWLLIKQKIIKPLLGRKSCYVGIYGPAPVAIFGLVLQKRQGNEDC